MRLCGNFGKKFDLLTGIGQRLLDSLLLFAEIKRRQFKFLFLLIFWASSKKDQTSINIFYLIENVQF